MTNYFTCSESEFLLVSIVHCLRERELCFDYFTLLVCTIKIIET